MSYDAIQEASDALRRHVDGTYSEPGLVSKVHGSKLI